MRLKDFEFEIRLGYIVGLRAAWAACRDPFLGKKNQGCLSKANSTNLQIVFLMGLDELVKVLRFLAHTQNKHSLLQISKHRWRKGYKETNQTFETVGVMSPLLLCLCKLFHKDLTCWSNTSTIFNFKKSTLKAPS